MDTNHIVLEIDAEISRLQQARGLLTGTKNSGRPKPRVSARASLRNYKPVRTLSAAAGSLKRTRAATRKQPKKLKSQALAPEPPVQPTVQVQYLPYKSKTRPQRIQHASKSSMSPTALTSRVPSGPVAVSADEARKRRQRQEEVKQSADFATGRDNDSKRTLSSLIGAMMSRERTGGPFTS